jgi:predicted glycosyltransferase
MSTSGSRLLIYSQDGFGLGHLRRNLNIAYRVWKSQPDVSVLVVADSPAAPFFALPPRCDFIKIPTLVKVDAGIWRSDRLSLDHREVLSIRTRLLEGLVESFRPDLVLVDHMPHGIFGELTGPLRLLRRRRRRPARIMLGLRDILGGPADICRHWRLEGAYEAAEQYYDGVCIYGCADVFDLVREYEFPASIAAKASYCGYVSREQAPPPLDDAEIKRMFPHRRENLVFVTGGGGADASFFMDKLIDAVRLMFPRVPFDTVLSTGPFMHPEQHMLLRRKAKGLPIHVTRHGQDNIRLLRRADLVISMAGYNTISEILRYRKRAIVVPRSGPSAEQTIRTRIMAERGLFKVVLARELTAEGFAALIRHKLEEPVPLDLPGIPGMDGAANAAERLLAANG